MAYNATYEVADVDDIVIDGLGTFGAAWVIWAGIIVLLTVVLWITGAFGKLVTMFRRM